MQVEIIRIGNSRGIRIPKPILEQCGLGDTADLSVERDRIVIAPNRAPRQGWDRAFAASKSGANDELLLERTTNRFDHEEWEW
jgi:antitoxin MazE